MHFSRLALTSAIAGLAAAAPFQFPLASGFPNLDAIKLAEVEKLAGGTLPNGALPSKLTAGAVQTLQLIAANELFEVAFFTELYNNITNKVPGYEFVDKYSEDTIKAVVNQEQVHVLAANGVLANAKSTTIEPCQYEFPVNDFESAIKLAETFTGVVLGVLPVAQTQFAEDGGDETGLVQVIGSIIAQEGEQNGLYRALQRKVASAAPLLTGGAAPFAYTAINKFIVDGTCPNIDVIGLDVLPALNVETIPEAKNSSQLFSIEGDVDPANASMAYLSGQNLPVVVPITGVNALGGKTFFLAEFPFEAGFARGLTLGALVSGASPSFNSSAEVAAATLFGPALIDVD